eukprot:6477990-Prymnesium_polylepis.1
MPREPCSVGGGRARAVGAARRRALEEVSIYRGGAHVCGHADPSGHRLLRLGRETLYVGPRVQVHDRGYLMGIQEAAHGRALVVRGRDNGGVRG